MNLKSCTVMWECARRNSGLCWYLANSVSHSCSVMGGRSPAWQQPLQLHVQFTGLQCQVVEGGRCAASSCWTHISMCVCACVPNLLLLLLLLAGGGCLLEVEWELVESITPWYTSIMLRLQRQPLLGALLDAGATAHNMLAVCLM